MTETTHPTDGRLRAFLDGEVADRADAKIEDHLRSCESCRERRDELLDAERVTREALHHLDSRPGPEEARETIRRRIAGGPRPERGRSGARSRFGAWGSLARAAAVAALLGTALAAGLPGSPVRDWVAGLWERATTERPDVPPTSAGEDPSAGGEVDAAAVRFAPSDGAVSIRLTGVEAGTRIRLALVDDATAGVEVPPGARFRSGAGFVEVGDVRDRALVEIPRAVRAAEVLVNGRTLFRKDGDAVTLPSFDADTVGTELLFRIPSREDGRSP